MGGNHCLYIISTGNVSIIQDRRGRGPVVSWRAVRHRPGTLRQQSRHPLQQGQCSTIGSILAFLHRKNMIIRCIHWYTMQYHRDAGFGGGDL